MQNNVVASIDDGRERGRIGHLLQTKQQLGSANSAGEGCDLEIPANRFARTSGHREYPLSCVTIGPSKQSGPLANPRGEEFVSIQEFRIQGQALAQA